MLFRIITILLTINFYTNYYSQEITFTHLNGPYGGVVGDIAIDSNDNIYAGVYTHMYNYYGLYRSTDNGNSWIKLNTPDNKIEVYAIFIDEQGTIFVGTDHGGRIWRSTDEGQTWLNLREGYNTGECWAFGKSKDGVMFAGDGEFEKVYRSTNYGETWEYSANLRPMVFAANSENTVYCGSFWGLFATQDNGDNWAQSNFLNNRPVSTILIDEFDGIYCGTGYYDNGDGVYYSPDKGVTWNHLGLEGKVVLSLAMDSKGNLYAGTLYDGVFIKEEGSNSWQQYTDGLYRKQVFRMKLNSKDEIFIGSENEGVYRSTNGGKSFEQIGLPVSHVENIVFDKSGKIYAATPSGVQSLNSSTNTWQNLGLYNVEAIDISLDEQLYAATFDEGVYRSTNFGLSWQQTNITKDTLFSVYNIKVLDDGTILASTERKLRRSTDNGESWEIKPINTSFFSTMMFKKNENIYVSAFNNEKNEYQIYKSMDFGINFTPIIYFPSWHHNNSLTVDNNQNLWISTKSINNDFNVGVYMSSPPYESWQKKLELLSICVEAKENTNLIIAGSRNGIYITYDFGQTWILALEEIKDLAIVTHLIFNTDNFLYVSTGGLGLYKSDLPTNIETKNEIATPDKIELHQNYPNPFNPATVIEYSIAQKAQVVLKVYDSLGKEVSVLVNEEKLAGIHKVEFKATGLPSGVYFYNIQAGQFRETKKLMLLK